MDVAAPHLLAVVGPTASGKTRLAISLARHFDGEIIGADSRQVYRYMNIGTAKPTAEERAQAPHHMIDVVDPDDDFSLSTFLDRAQELTGEIRARNRLPILVGGTGQYIWAFLEGWNVPHVPPQEEFREAKLRQAEAEGPSVIYEELKQADPKRAEAIDPRNLRRVIRALEVHQFGPDRQSQPAKSAEPVPALILGLTMPRKNLYHRIDARVDAMMEQGLLAESVRLAKMGYRLGQGPLASPGYRELGQYLEGEISLEEAVQRTKFQTHRLARRQYTWFKPDDPRIVWLDARRKNLEERALAKVREYLEKATPVIQ